MPQTPRPGHAPVVFTDDAFDEDVARAGSGGRVAAEVARQKYERDGVPVDELREVQDEGRDGTILPNCLKVYLPRPDGRFGIVKEPVTRTQDSVEVRHGELSDELSSSLDTQVAVIGWREGFDYHADLALAPGQWTRVVLSPRVEEPIISLASSSDSFTPYRDGLSTAVRGIQSHGATLSALASRSACRQHSAISACPTCPTCKGSLMPSSRRLPSARLTVFCIWTSADPIFA